MGRKIIALGLVALLVITGAVTVFAEDFDYGKTGAISITLTEQYKKEAIVGAELSVYYVATVGINTSGNLNYIYAEPFNKAEIAIDDPDLAVKLDAFVSREDVPALKLITDQAGTAACSDLPLGMYFVKQTGAVEGYAPCTSFLVTVPCETAEGYTYEVNASPKTQVAKLTDITIKKVWNTDASTKAAESVTVQLLRNEEVVATAILNAQNNWQITYTDMPESDAYSVIFLQVLPQHISKTAMFSQLPTPQP